MEDVNKDEVIALLPENFEYFVEKSVLTSDDKFSATVRVKSITCEKV